MVKFVSLESRLESGFPFNIFLASEVKTLRHKLLAQSSLNVNILETLKRSKFQFHRISSCSDIGSGGGFPEHQILMAEESHIEHKNGDKITIRGRDFSDRLFTTYSGTKRKDSHAVEGKASVLYWGGGYGYDSKLASMSASSCSSFQMSASIQSAGKEQRDVRSVAQQTDISCRTTPGLISPISHVDWDDPRVRERIADSMTYSSPSAHLSPGGPARSRSILSSVCALLLSKQGSALVPKEVASLPGSPNSDIICRICFGSESAERLVRPCSCRGTIAAVHRTCLEKWLLQAATSYCELCRHHYVVKRSHKWSWVRSLAEWLRSEHGHALAADVWRGAALGAASVLGTARALHACDHVLQAGARRGGGAALAANLFSSLLIGIIGALNGLLTTWMLLKIQEHQMSWQSWRDSTLHVRVTLADDESPTPVGSDTTVVGGQDGVATNDRSTNVADPFMIAPPPPPSPFFLQEPF